MRTWAMSIFVFLLFFSSTGLLGIKKKRKKNVMKHTLLVDKPTRFYSFISEYLFAQTEKNHYPDGMDNDSLFFENLNRGRVSIKIVSNFPLTQKDVDRCFPALLLKNNGQRNNNSTVIWDIRPMEKRILPLIHVSNTETRIKKQKNVFERHPYYCAGLGMLSTGISCGAAGWFLRELMNNKH